MKYEIKCKSDSLTGAALVVKVPENELDKKALYTIQADKPEFILPFRSRSVDGSIEFVYQVGLNNKLQYLTGRRRPKEYAELWTSLLSPLLVCGDWFMKPYSFALSAEFLYYDKNKKTASYVYVPTVGDSSDYGDLREMAAEVSKIISVADPNLENMVLRAVMKDFDPQEFLHMLRTYIEGTARAMAAYAAPPMYQPSNPPANQPANRPAKPPAPGGREAVSAPHAPRSLAQLEREGDGEQSPASGDVLIDIPDNGSPKKKNKEKAKKSKGKGDKTAAEAKKPSEPHGLFGKKKTAKLQGSPPAPMGRVAPAAAMQYAAYPPAPMGHGAPGTAVQYAAYPPAPASRAAPAPAMQYAAYPPAPMGRGAPGTAMQYAAYPAMQYAAYPAAPMGRGAPAPAMPYMAYPSAPMGRATPAPVSQYLAYPPAPMDRTTPDLIAQYLGCQSAPTGRSAPATPAAPPAAAPCAAYPHTRAAYARAIALLAENDARTAGCDAPRAPCADARDDTQSITVAEGEARLRHIGRGQLPQVISVQIKEGEIFTIGRYDAAVGGQQSNFEFDRATKAISRRHAVVERDAEGYKIIDLASSAGTFLNGQKLPPNTPSILEQGCHVSFGNCGADYVWEK